MDRFEGPSSGICLDTDPDTRPLLWFKYGERSLMFTCGGDETPARLFGLGKDYIRSKTFVLEDS